MQKPIILLRTDGFSEGSLPREFAQLVGGAALLSGTSRAACLDFCERHPEMVLGALPFSLAELADACGFATMFDLVLAYGGRKLYLPTRAERFAEQTGLAFAMAPYARWRNRASYDGQVDIPSAWGLFLALRRAAIQIALSQQWPTDALVSTFGMTRRQLRSARISVDPIT